MACSISLRNGEEVGYRARAMDIANALVLAGAVESQDGGRAEIVDGGDGDKLEPGADRMRSALMEKGIASWWNNLEFI